MIRKADYDEVFWHGTHELQKDKKIMKEIPCWIRGDFSVPNDDAVRAETARCPHRVASQLGVIRRSFVCHHPAVYSEHQADTGTDDVIVMGGIDGFATFCLAVDLHLTSLGEKSRLFIEPEYQMKDPTPLLAPPEDL